MMRLLISMFACMANPMDSVEVVTTDEVQKSSEKANAFMSTPNEEPRTCDCYGETVGTVDDHGECQCDEKLSEWKVSDLRDFIENYGLHHMDIQKLSAMDGKLKMSQREFNERASQRNWANWGKFATFILIAAITAFVVLVVMNKIIFNFGPSA